MKLNYIYIYLIGLHDDEKWTGQMDYDILKHKLKQYTTHEKYYLYYYDAKKIIIITRNTMLFVKTSAWTHQFSVEVPGTCKSKYICYAFTLWLIMEANTNIYPLNNG